MKEFKDKVAVITGAASGIGFCIAERCVQEGAKVVLADIEEAALVDAKNRLQAKEADVLTVVTDVSKAESVENLAQAALDKFGAVHLLFNNAGVSTGNWIWDFTVEDWEWIFGVNLWGVIHGIRSFVPMMREQDVECHIVNTSSLCGMTSLAGAGGYTASKHAVVAISETLYHELNLLNSKVGVSVLCPTGVHTRINESERNRPETSSSAASTAAGPALASGLVQKWWERVWQGAIKPEQLTEKVFEAIENKQFYILTHPEYNETIRARHEDIQAERNPTNPYTVKLGDE